MQYFWTDPIWFYKSFLTDNIALSLVWIHFKKLKNILKNVRNEWLMMHKTVFELTSKIVLETFTPSWCKRSDPKRSDSFYKINLQFKTFYSQGNTNACSVFIFFFISILI